jgi:hypothetical protein
MLKRSFLAVFLSMAMIAASMPLAAQTPASGQINGLARASNGKTLGQTARLRPIGSTNVASTAPISATGEFSFTGVQFGEYMVDIVDQAGAVVGTTSTISVTAATAVVSGVTASAVSTSMLAGILGATGSLFTSTAGILTAAAIAGGLTAGVVATNNTASGSK